jgi:uncharacterized protein
MQASLQQWLGDVIDVQALEVTTEDSKLQIFLSYEIRRTGEQRNEVFERDGVL